MNNKAIIEFGFPSYPTQPHSTIANYRQSRKQSPRNLLEYLPLQIVVFPLETVVSMCKLYPVQDVNMCRQSLPEDKE